MDIPVAWLIKIYSIKCIFLLLYGNRETKTSSSDYEVYFQLCILINVDNLLMQ